MNLDFWYRFMVEKVKGVDMRIKHEMFDIGEIVKCDEWGDKPLRQVAQIVDIEDDYDFYEDETVEIERLINPAKIVPNDSLRYSIINIIAYMCGKMVNEYMVLYTKQDKSYSPNRPCALTMKNEFLFDRVLITDSKKNYASRILVQEGNIVPNEEGLDVKGLQIRKSTLPKRTRDELQKILDEDILRSKDKLDQKTILKHMILLEKQIYKSLSSGSKEYYKPAQVKAMSSYEKPMSNGNFKACVVWNELVSGLDLERHDTNLRNAVDIVKVVLSPKTVDRLKDFPEVYQNAIRIINDPNFGSGINGIAIPLGTEVPEWVFQIIDYTTIINNNLSVMPLESVNIKTFNNGNLNYTNIVNL